MPTENELKFILNLNLSELLKNPESELKDPITILQGYLYSAPGTSLRIRNSSTLRGPDIGTLTYKQHIRAYSGSPARTVEIETLIDALDWHDLFCLVAQETLVKTRYHYYAIQDGKTYKWEIDFFWEKFHNNGDPYFILAELEMPEGQLLPDFVPEFIQNYLVYAVPREETQDFSSRKLSDIEYAILKYAELTL